MAPSAGEGSAPASSKVRSPPSSRAGGRRRQSLKGLSRADLRGSTSGARPPAPALPAGGAAEVSPVWQVGKAETQMAEAEAGAW